MAVPVLSFLLLALAGCGKNSLSSSDWKMSLASSDGCTITFTIAKQLAEIPVVEYTITTDAEGKNKVNLVLLKKAITEVSKHGVYRADVSRLDDHRFSVKIPLGDGAGYPVTHFFVDGKPLDAWASAVVNPKEE